MIKTYVIVCIDHWNITLIKLIEKTQTEKTIMPVLNISA